jgi:hypothetical protein
MVLAALILSSQFFTLKIKNKIESDRIQNQNNYQANGIKFLESSLKGVSLSQFDQGLLFQLNPDNNLLRPIFFQFGADYLLDKTRVTNKLTSFIINSRADGYEIKYISACIPINKALAWHDISYQNLIKNNLWPFVTESNGNVRVNCCPKSHPTCRENSVIDINTQYVVQIFRYDPKMAVLKPILNRGEFGSVSSAGFFVYVNKHFQNKMRARFFTFFNECLSQRIIFGKSSHECNNENSFKSDDISGSSEDA